MTEARAHRTMSVPPRMMTDAELREYFGLPERALRSLRADRAFPRKNPIVGKTDRRAVDNYFDRVAGLANPLSADNVVDGQEDFS